MNELGFGLVSFGLVLLIGAWCNWKLRPRWKDVDGVRVPAWWTDDMVASWAARRLTAEARTLERGQAAGHGLTAPSDWTPKQIYHAAAEILRDRERHVKDHGFKPGAPDAAA